MAITIQELALLTSSETGAKMEFWRGPIRGTLDESLIVSPWLPTVIGGWVDVSNQVLLTSQISVDNDKRANKITFSIADEGRLTWPDNCSVAVVAQAWDGGAWTARTLLGWAYLDGSGAQSVSAAGDQQGDRTATYDGYWSRISIPPHNIGRPNLAKGASIGGSTPPLASVLAEAPLEYISQDSNNADKTIDQNLDSVYIGDIIADPAQPTIGSDGNVHILRFYAGRTTRTIGAGNEPIWIELCYVHEVATWGAFTSSGSVPAIQESDGSSNVRNDAAVTSTIVTSGPVGAYYQIRAKTGQRDPSVSNGVQWNFGIGVGDRPAKMILEYSTSDVPSLSKVMRVTMKGLAADATAISKTLSVASAWQTEEFDLDLSKGGGLVLRFQNAPGMVATTDMYFRFRWKIYVGYRDLDFATAHGYAKLSLSWDNGIGAVNTRRIAWDLANGTEDWGIPPLGTVIITDDEKTFRAKFDPGNRQVFQMRNLDKDWFFGPGIGKLALRYGNVAGYQIYNPAGYTTIEEINFTTNGFSWTPTQGMSRQSPIGTGAFAVESFPHVGLLPGAYGGGYVWLDLKAYAATSLSFGLTSGVLIMKVDDANRVVVGAQALIGAEIILIQSRNDDTFTILRAQSGTTAAAHNAGDAVTPRLSSATQTGPQWDNAEIRRKPGTPALKAGVVVASNLASPGDPSVGGSKWERHPDWFLISRFDNPAQAEIINLRPPGGLPIQARHVCVGDIIMHRWAGVAQRLKINEIVVREFLPGSSSASGFAGHAENNVAQVIGHMLTQHAAIPTGKVWLRTDPAPMGDLAIATGTMDQIIDNLASDEIQVWMDAYNNIYIDPSVMNPYYDSRDSYVTIDESVLLSPPSGDWTVPQPVALVKGSFQESSTFRVHVSQYPDIAGLLGETVQISGGTVRNVSEVRAKLERRFRVLNVRRSPKNVTIGPAPWARPGLRVVYNSPNLDHDGQFSGVNCVIKSYSHKFEWNDDYGLIWTTDLSLGEIVL